MERSAGESSSRLNLAAGFNRGCCTGVVRPGHERECDRFEGLFDVMGRHRGPDWDPVDEIHLHALIQSVDGETTNPALQNRHAQLSVPDKLQSRLAGPGARGRIPRGLHRPVHHRGLRPRRAPSTPPPTAEWTIVRTRLMMPGL